MLYPVSFGKGAGNGTTELLNLGLLLVVARIHVRRFGGLVPLELLPAIDADTGRDAVKSGAAVACIFFLRDFDPSSCLRGLPSAAENKTFGSALSCWDFFRRVLPPSLLELFDRGAVGGASNRSDGTGGTGATAPSCGLPLFVES